MGGDDGEGESIRESTPRAINLPLSCATITIGVNADNCRSCVAESMFNAEITLATLLERRLTRDDSMSVENSQSL